MFHSTNLFQNEAPCVYFYLPVFDFHLYLHFQTYPDSYSHHHHTPLNKSNYANPLDPFHLISIIGHFSVYISYSGHTFMWEHHPLFWSLHSVKNLCLSYDLILVVSSWHRYRFYLLLSETFYVHNHNRDLHYLHHLISLFVFPTIPLHLPQNDFNLLSNIICWKSPSQEN